MKQTLIFSAVDTLFFKESRPMETPGSSELGSLFPPPARTIMGAIRTYIGENQDEGIDWRAFASDEKHPLRSQIGYGDDFGQLHLNGIWIHHNGERLYPAPLNLLAKTEPNQPKQLCYLHVGKPEDCDLGKQVCLPAIPKNQPGFKPLKHYWLSKQGLEKVLSGQLPTDRNNDKNADLIHIDELMQEEHRLGIARDNQHRTVRNTMLYQTRHIRPKATTTLAVELSGAMVTHDGLLRLGGEARLATLKTNQTTPALPKPKNIDKNKLRGIILYLLTPMKLPSGSAFLPDFKRCSDESIACWQGRLGTQSIALKLISCAIGKAHREGGWDMAENKPKTVNNLIPAGSVFYCEVDQAHTISTAIDALHNQQIGEEQALGRGHIAVGLWHQDNKGSSA